MISTLHGLELRFWVYIDVKLTAIWLNKVMVQSIVNSRDFRNISMGHSGRFVVQLTARNRLWRFLVNLQVRLHEPPLREPN